MPSVNNRTNGFVIYANIAQAANSPNVALIGPKYPLEKKATISATFPGKRNSAIKMFATPNKKKGKNDATRKLRPIQVSSLSRTLENI